MPIRPPALDDRSFDDLVADLVRRIPAHTPEWTDAREGDPGRTLIDLFAWLGDTILYRANLIPERQRLAFLRLLGQQMRAAEPARGLVEVRIDDPLAATGVTLPTRTPITKPVDFELLAELSVQPVLGRCYIKRRPSAPEAASLSALVADLRQLYPSAGGATAYITTPVFAEGAAEPGGRDFVADSIDGCLWMALLAATPEPGLVAKVTKTLGGGDDNRRVALTLGVVPAVTLPGTLEAIAARAPIPHVWEICAGGEDYLPLEVLGDATGGLTRPGTTRLLLPGSDDFAVPTNDVLADINAGVGHRPPRIDDPVTAARIVAWLRLRPLPEAKLGSLRLAWASANVAAVEQRRTLGRQQIGRGTGASGQSFPLGIGSVDPASLVLQVEEEEGMRSWQQVADVDAAPRGARVYSLDSEEGTVRFGRFTVPGAGRAVQVAAMRAGGGTQGNIPPGALKGLVAPAGAPKLALHQPLAFTGGIDAERLDDAEARIPAMLRHGGRAVTRSDIAELALRTPGVPVGRVEVLERFKPQQRRGGIPGVVSVMVIPARAGTAKPAPRADRAMLETVHAWLDARRPLATELYVIAPEYVPVGVTAAVELIDQDQRDVVLDRVAEVIRAHLWPLAPGGPDGGGWPLGRALDDRLIETAIARVAGVRTVAPVRLFLRSTYGTGWNAVGEDASGRGRIALQPWQLPELAMLSVAIGSSSAASLPPPMAGSGGGAGQGGADSGSGAGTGTGGAGGDGGLGIPVVPELC